MARLNGEIHDGFTPFWYLNDPVAFEACRRRDARAKASKSSFDNLVNQIRNQTHTNIRKRRRGRKKSKTRKRRLR